MKKIMLFAVLMIVLLAGIVSANNGVNILNASLALAGGFQQTVTGTFDVSNTGTATESIVFSNLTLQAGARSLVINPISAVNNLAAATTQTVTFTIPLGTSFAATYTGQILAAATTNATANDSMALSVVVNPTNALTATNPSITVAKGLSKSATFTLSNTGNTDLNPVTLVVGSIASGSNVLPSSSIVLSKTSTSVAFGATDTITVTVNAPSGQVSGTYSGPITITHSGGSVTATLSVTVRDGAHSVRFNTSEIKLGSSTQERNVTQSATFVIENDGDFTESITLSVSNIVSSLNPQLSKTSVTLAPGATDSVTLTLAIPLRQDSGIQTAGQVVLSFSSTSTSKDIKIETISKLSFDNVDVKVDGRSSSNLNNGDTVSRDAKPEDTLEFDTELRNLFSSSSDVDIEDIDLKITIQDIDDGDDLDDEKSSIDISADDTQSVKMSFKVPLVVDEKTFTVFLEADGEDDNGATHSATMTIKLKVKKEDDDIRVTRNELTSSSLSCVRTTSLRVEVRNFGSDDQDDVEVAVFNQQLNLNIKVPDLSLDSNSDDDDDEFARTFDIVVPDSAKSGTYPIDVLVFINNNNQMDKETAQLRVQACEDSTTGTPTTQPKTDTTVIVDKTPTTQPPAGEPQIDFGDSVETPFTQTPLFIALLVFGNIVILGVIVLFVVKLLV